MKRIVTYSSPKEYQETRRNPNSNPGIKKWPCKRLKGEHKYAKWKRVVYSWNPSIVSGLWERFCVGCQHKETWLAPSFSLGKYFDIVDRTKKPPGYEEEV